MGKIPASPDLNFRLAAGLGPDHGIVRGVVGLQRRNEAVIPDTSFNVGAEHLSQYLYNSVLLVALDTGRAATPPVGSVLISEGRTERGRKSTELSYLLVDPEYEDAQGLAATLVALSSQGLRHRVRPVRARINPNQDYAREALVGLGFRKEPPAFEGMEKQVYRRGAGHLAVRGAKHLPDGKSKLRQASKDLSWD